MAAAPVPVSVADVPPTPVVLPAALAELMTSVPSFFFLFFGADVSLELSAADKLADVSLFLLDADISSLFYFSLPMNELLHNGT